MKYPNDIKLAMRNCILNLLWPKKDIVAFLINNNVSDSIKNLISSYSEKTRAQIIDETFLALDQQDDSGIGQYRSIMKSLLNWNHFDPYYFDNLKKLKRSDAETALSHLRQIQEIRDFQTKSQMGTRKAESSETQSVVFDDLKSRYYAMIAGSSSAQKRGYEFEKLLHDLAKHAALETTEPFRANGEQIDGAIKYDGEHYIIEAKWQAKEMSNEAVYQFAGKVEGKMYGRGIFISVNGFSDNVVQSLVSGKAIKTIFVDGEDLSLVFEKIISFSAMLDAKIKAAQTKGHIYIHPITTRSK